MTMLRFFHFKLTLYCDSCSGDKMLDGNQSFYGSHIYVKRKDFSQYPQTPSVKPASVDTSSYTPTPLPRKRTRERARVPLDFFSNRDRQYSSKEPTELTCAKQDFPLIEGNEKCPVSPNNSQDNILPPIIHNFGERLLLSQIAGQKKTQNTSVSPLIMFLTLGTLKACLSEKNIPLFCSLFHPTISDQKFAELLRLLRQEAEEIELMGFLISIQVSHKNQVLKYLFQSLLVEQNICFSTNEIIAANYFSIISDCSIVINSGGNSNRVIGEFFVMDMRKVITVPMTVSSRVTCLYNTIEIMKQKIEVLVLDIHSSFTATIIKAVQPIRSQANLSNIITALLNTGKLEGLTQSCLPCNFQWIRIPHLSLICETELKDVLQSEWPDLFDVSNWDGMVSSNIALMKLQSIRSNVVLKRLLIFVFVFSHPLVNISVLEEKIAAVDQPHPPEYSKTFALDSPFFLTIRHVHSNCVVFAGMVTEPVVI